MIAYQPPHWPTPIQSYERLIVQGDGQRTLQDLVCRQTRDTYRQAHLARPWVTEGSSAVLPGQGGK